MRQKTAVEMFTVFAYLILLYVVNCNKIYD